MSTPHAAQAANEHARPPRVSVVVAVCGRREKTLACLASLRAQRMTDAEIVVVDDGSADGTPDAVEALAAADGPIPIRVFRNGRNLGANPSRNRGVREARGALVAFIDSDCIADPDWLAQLAMPFVNSSVGAVSGLVEDRASSSIWELAFRGTHRLPHAGPVGRIVIGNLCVRRKILLAHLLDESRPVRRTADGAPDLAISARSDEEGLNLAIRAAGWTVLAHPAARVEHDHPYTRAALLRQAWFGGMSACDIVWKYRLGPRKDLGPILFFHLVLLATLCALPFVAPDSRTALLLAPCAALALPVAAISYNELRNKGKSLAELLRAAPALFVYYHVRLAGYLVRRLEIARGVRRPERADLRALARALPSPPSRSCAEERPQA